MATPKTGRPAKTGKKPQASTAKASANKSGASKAKTAKRSSGSRGSETGTQKLTPEIIKQRNQMKSVILFAVAIFIFFLVVIQGDNIWRFCHDFVIGMLGWWSIMGVAILIYIAFVTAMDNKPAYLKSRVWLSVFLVAFLCAAGYIFGSSKTPELGIIDYIKYLYSNNTDFSGGVVGGLLAAPLLFAAGETGAKIIVALVLFVLFMILTGTTLPTLFKTMRKPVDAVSDGIQNAKRQRQESSSLMGIEDNYSYTTTRSSGRPGISPNIDVPLDEGGMNNPVSDYSTMPAKRSALDRLKEAFGMEVSHKADNAESYISEQQESDDFIPYKRGEDPLEREFEEIANVRFPGQIQEKDNKAKPDGSNVGFDQSYNQNPSKSSTGRSFGQTAAQNSIPTSGLASQTLPEDADLEAARDAEKATQDFLKRQAADMKSELAVAPAAKIETVRNTYCFPPVSMLESGKASNVMAETEELQTNGRVLVETLKSFGVQTKILDICRGPAVTRYELQPAAGVKISKITNLSDDLAMNLAAIGVRIEAPIPGKAAVGIEVPNKKKTIVRMRELIESNSFSMSKSKLTVVLGRDIAGKVTVADLAKMPHLLIAGTTGSGKSVCINSLIISLLYKASPEDVRLLMIDPKVVELGIYNGVPHLLVPVVTDPRKAAGALGWAVTEMLNRYSMFAEKNVRDIEGYNNYARSIGYQDENGQPVSKMPQIVIIIDELSDLMMAAPNEVEDSICRLAQMARAAGMHLVVATQRPSVDVVTGLIKANIPSRIAFAVSSAVDSRTILDGGGAEKLLGQGDMLFSPVGASKPTRVQGCYVSDAEVESVTEFVKKSHTLDYDEAVIQEIEKNAVADTSKSKENQSDESSDPMMEEAIKCVVEAGQASTSLLQRRLRLGYARAGRLIDDMEQMGIVGPHEGSKPRQVLMSYNQWLEKNMMRADRQDTETAAEE